MTVHELLTLLGEVPTAKLHLMLPSGEFVPSHFHITEVGRIQKDFIDCGGTTRSTVSCMIQAWVANDVTHRLTTDKLAGILRMAASLLQSDELPVEIEYENELVSQYPLTGAEITPSGILLHLGTKHTDCLAPDRCGVPAIGKSSCRPVGGCC